jgi:hypothetical protein
MGERNKLVRHYINRKIREVMKLSSVKFDERKMDCKF